MKPNPTTPGATAQAAGDCAEMMPGQKTAAIEESVSAVRTLAWRVRLASWEWLTAECIAGSGHHGRRLERVVRRRRRNGPLQRVRAFPWPGGCRCTETQCLQHDVQEEHLGQSEAERADGGDLVPVGELGRVVGDPARHSGEPEEMHREERDVEADHRGPEVNLAKLLVIHPAGPFRQPVVDAA